MISIFIPDHLTPVLRDYRNRFEHFLIIVAPDDVINETKIMLDSFSKELDSYDYKECSDEESECILLNRYVAGMAPKRSQIVNSKNSEELLPLDIALPRNCEFWHEIISDDILSSSFESFQMAHFMCMVFHWDFLLKKNIDANKLKEKILKKLDLIGAKYPAEHNVGHFYKADEDLAYFYKSLDPTNSFNAGIGKLSKKRFYN